MTVAGDERRTEVGAGDVSDAVKIVTCHASKGLEYPVVFLVQSGGDNGLRLFMGEDATVDQMDSQFSGIGSSHKDYLTDGQVRKHLHSLLRF